MRILMFSQYYPPEIGATQNRMHYFASRLAALGHHVTMIAEVPNHPSGIIRPEFRRVAVRRTIEDGVHVVRVWVKTGPRKTFLVRIGFYLTYAFNAALAAFFLSGRRHDVVFATSPPLTVGLPAYLYSKLRRAPLVLDIRDLWPVLAVELGEMRSGRVIRLARRLELLLYRHASAVSVVTRGFARYVSEQGVEESRVVLLPNGTMPEIFHPEPPDAALRRSLGADGKFMVGFFGNHGIAQDLEGVLDAAQMLSDDDRFRFVFVGEGPVKAELHAKRDRLGLINVQFLPQVPQLDIVRYINTADAVLVPLRRLELFSTFIPSKLFDFMACARPVVLQVDGEARQVLEESGGGVFVPPGDPQALASALRRLADLPEEQRRAMGLAGLAFVQRHYLREQQVPTLAGVLDAARSGRTTFDPAVC